MAYKPEIQYVGQFYVYGSEAKQVAPARTPKQQKQTMPLLRPEPVQERKVVIDPIALIGMVVAVVMLVTLVMGALQIKTTWQAYDQMETYLGKLKNTNAQLTEQYRAGYDLEEIRATAITLGMIPASDARVISLQINIPEPEPEPTVWEEISWFMKGLFA